MTRARDLAAGTFELATGGVLKLETSDTTVTDGSVLGKIEFKAPDEASGTDANLTAAAIEAVAEGTFAADNNATELVFKTGASAAADAKMTLTSGGNLGIGTSSPSSPLQIQSSNNQIRLVDSQNTSMYCVIETISDAGLSFNADVGNAAASSRIQFNVDNNEKMRIDSSGNLLVGTTSFTGTSGVSLSATGYVYASSTNDVAIYANRETSDGDIAVFRKDGTTVGSIGTNANYLHIGSPVATDAFIGMGGGQVYPATSAGAYRDNEIDLGGTTRRWKDLYLSGGVYLGGTGSANFLSDYEEGTFSATWVGSGTSGPSSTMKYTKIGNTVHIFGNTASTAPNPTGSIELSGLPFTPSEDSTGSILYRKVTALSGQHTLVAFIPSSTTKIQLYWSAQGEYAKLQSSQLNFSGAQDMYFGVTYMTA